uniref:Heteropteran venom family 5 protein 2 n=1 Tax=Oncocephalus sp. TaxID=2944721 RepID=A0AB38ZEK3_9HEMI
MISSVVFILAFATSTVLTATVNEKIDEILPHINKYFASKRFDSVQIPDFGYPAAPVFIGVQLSNLTTLYRTGDCQVTQDGENIKVKLNIGLKDMKTSIMLVPYMHGPGSFVFTGASAELGITMMPEGTDSCRISWEYITIKTLGDVIGYCFNKEFDGKAPPEQLKGDIIPYYNKRLNGQEMFSIKNLNSFLNLCELKEVADAFRSFKK